ncbi:MAG: endonuclease/exonuclease/phosphatase family protein [Pirellulales bacterium]
MFGMELVCAMGCDRRRWSIGVATLVISLTATHQAACAEPLKVMTFNIRYGTAEDGENAWPKRRELVFQMLREEAPQVIGLQEALRFQLDELREALPDFGEIGVGRDDGRVAGEYAAILYDRRRLEVLNQGTFWFSRTPGTPGSITWGGSLPRVCSWARLRDKTGDREFYLYNVHWDHVSQESREKSGVMLLDQIVHREKSGAAVVVTGDFNAEERNTAYQRLLISKDVTLRDTFRTLHPDEKSVGTFHGFQGGSDGAKIDFVLVSPEWQVEAANIVRTHRDKIYPSDHYPVTATIELEPATK